MDDVGCLRVEKTAKKFGGSENLSYLCGEKDNRMEERKPTKFILALRRYREHKRQWTEEIQATLAAEEEKLRRKREYLYYDIEAV